MEQFVLLLIIAAISLVNWLLQKSAEHREKRNAERARGDSIHPTSSERTTQTHSERQFDPADQTRKFLEALGLPEDALPPRPVAPPPLPAEMASAPARRDFLHKIRPDLEQRLFPDATAQVSERPTPAPKHRPFPVPNVNTATASSARRLVNGMLSQKDGLRQAVLMREVLGPPKALQ